MTTAKPIEVHGHRGCRGMLPENTIPAFLKAITLGVDAIELDVVVTGDGQVLVSHEPYFAAETCLQPDGSEITQAQEKEHNIYQLTYEQIKQYDCGRKASVHFPEQQQMPAYKPLLSEVITATEAFIEQEGLEPVLYNIEIKSSLAGDTIFHPAPAVFVQLLLSVLEEHQLEESRYMIQSFDQRPLQLLHELAPGIRLGLLVEDDLPAALHITRLGFKPYAFNPHFLLLNSNTLSYAKSEGIKVFVWTVNTSEEIDNMIRMGVDGIITDYPALLLKEKMLKEEDNQ